MQILVLRKNRSRDSSVPKFGSKSVYFRDNFQHNQGRGPRLSAAPDQQNENCDPQEQVKGYPQTIIWY